MHAPGLVITLEKVTANTVAAGIHRTGECQVAFNNYGFFCRDFTYVSVISLGSAFSNCFQVKATGGAAGFYLYWYCWSLNLFAWLNYHHRRLSSA